MNLLITQFSPACCYFILLRSKYSPKYSVLEHVQSAPFFSRDRPGFAPIQTADRLNTLL